MKNCQGSKTQIQDLKSLQSDEPILPTVGKGKSRILNLKNLTLNYIFNLGNKILKLKIKNQNFSPVDKEFACMFRLLNVSVQPAETFQA